MKKFFKRRYLALLVLVITGIALAAPINWSHIRQNSDIKLSQIGMEFTSDGTPEGAKVMQINTGGRVVVFGPLLDGFLNPFLTGYTETDPVFTANSGDYFPLAGNSISNPITGALFMGDATTSYNMEIGTTIVKIGGYDIPISTPIITPMSTIPGFGVIPILITKGWNFFIGETGADTQIFLSSADTNFITSFNQRDDKAKFSITLSSGDTTNGIASWTFDKDGTIQASQDITPYIDDNKDFITKGYLDANMPVLDDYVTLGTNQTIIGSKTFDGTTYMNGPLIYRLGWMGSANTGWSTDENGIEYVGYQCSDFTDNSLMSKNCIETLVTDNLATLTGFLPLAGNSELTAISGDVYFQPDRTLQRGEVGALNGYINYSDVSKEISMNTYDQSTNKNGFVRIQNGYPEMGYSHNGSFRFVKLQTGGLAYQEDYSGSYTNRSLVDKGYIDGKNYVPYTAIDTGWNHTNSNTIIPSEKAVRGLVDNLTQSYIPMWSGDRLYDTYIQQSGLNTLFTGRVFIGTRSLYADSGSRSLSIGEGNNIMNNNGLSVGYGINNGAPNSFVGGYQSNSSVNSDISFVFGHSSKTNNANLSVALGSRAWAIHNNTFIWSDNRGSAFSSAKSNTFLIDADNGVGIGTNNPLTGGLTVSGGIQVGNTSYSCGANTAGTMKYSGTNFFGCNGTSRTQLDN